MAYRKLRPDISVCMLDEAIKLGAKNGVDKVSTMELAKNLGITDPLIFNYYKTKQNLIDKAYSRSVELLKNAIKDFDLTSKDFDVKAFWNAGFEYMLANPEVTKYFENYRHTPAFHPADTYNISKQFVDGCAVLLNTYCTISYTQDVYISLWTNVVDSTADFAIKVVEGVVEDTEANRRFFFLTSMSVLTK